MYAKISVEFLNIITPIEASNIEASNRPAVSPLSPADGVKASSDA